MKKRIRLPSLVLGLLFVSIASAQTTFVAGPLEARSADSRQITVLGQTYLIDGKTVFTLGSKRLNGVSGGRVLAVGSWISVESAGARIATLVSVSGSQYVSGASPVFVSGRIEQVASDLGTIRLGGLTIDASAALFGSSAGLRVGSFVEVSGTQPLPQGVLLADRIVLAVSRADATADSIGSTGSGASLQSIGGTGSNASLHSIGGTGKNASLESIGGTGTSVSSQGTGGTGKNASLQSIGGTGKSVSLNSIGGTGSNASLQSIGGTGRNVALNSIGGTGAAAL
jgi:hypothetical protein